MSFQHRGFILKTRGKTVKAYQKYNLFYSILLNYKQIYNKLSLTLYIFRNPENIQKMQSRNQLLTSRKVQKKLYQFLFKQSHVTPLIFFGFVLIKQFELVSSQYSSYSLFYVGIVFLVASCFNHFLLYSSVLTSTIGTLGPYNITIGLLGSNQRWKLNLFWFSACYYFTNSKADILQIFVIAISCLICIETFRELIFTSIEDNMAYFTGFFTLLFVHLFSYIIHSTQIFQFRSAQKLSVIPVFILVGYSIITLKIHKVKYCQPTTIKNPLIFTQYINMLKESVKKQQNIHCYIYTHKQKCLKIDCFCRQFTQQKLLQIRSQHVQKLSQLIINSLFIQYFQSHNLQYEDRLILMHKYIEFLIDCNQYPRAMIILTQLNQQVMTYFNRAQYYRIKVKLQNYLCKQEYFDKNRQKIKHIYTYDLEVGYVIKQLREIIQDKVQFWKELCKQNPLLKNLQKMGRNLVTKIQDLHKYFMFTIRPSQQILSSFKCTIIYATYLLLATNYTQFANSLIKKIQKIMEQNKSQAEALGMQFGIFLRISQNYDRLVESSYEMTIDNISTDLTSLLKQQKQKILSKNVVSFIPEQFKTIHSKKFDQYVKNMNAWQNTSSFIGNNIQLPFSAGNNEVIFLNMIAGLRFDPISSCAIVKCLLTRTKNESINFIVGINGNIIYKQSDLCKEQLQAQSVKQILCSIKKKWQVSGQVQRIQTKTVDRQNPTSIIFQPLYLSQLKSEGIKPLIRIEIKSENFNHQKLKVNNYLVSNKVKKIQGNHEGKETDSQSSNTSRKDSVQNVLSVLMESSSLKMQVFLSITLLLILICAIVSFLVSFNLFLIWSTEVKEKSPTFIVINLINLKSLINTAISWKYDCLRYQKSPPYMASLYKMLYNGTSVPKIGHLKFEQIFIEQQNIVNKYFFGLDREINKQLKSLLTKNLTIKNPTQDVPVQNMSMQNILLNYLVDIYTLYDDQSYNNTLLSFSFISQFYHQLTQIRKRLTIKLQNQIIALRSNNFITISFISVMMIAFILPIWRFNVTNKKKHEKIFSLLASIQSKLIIAQIKKLEKIQNEIFIESSHEPVQYTENNNEKMTSFQNIQHLQANILKKQQKEHKKALDIPRLIEGIKRVAAQQIVNNSKNRIPFKIRKRAGQIQISGSDCDKKKFRFKDWGAVLFLFLFLGVIHGVIWQKIIYINRVDDHFKMSIQQLKNLQDNTIAILNSKLFADDYNNTNQLTFMGQDIPSYLRNWIINYNSTSSFPITNQISVKTCSANIIACKNLFSQKTFQGIIKKGISDSYQWSKAALDPITFSTSEHFNNDFVTLQKMRYMLIFSQQLVDHLTNQRFQWSLESFNGLQLQQIEQYKIKTILSIIFWVLIAVFCIFSVIYRISVKKSYIKQVTLLSILNKQMLYNNKRVQSFLHKLAKAS